MKTILPQSRFLVFVFLLANLFFVNVSFGQIVMLDQADLDYAPGETVHITGSGWQPGETVMLEVANLTNPDVDCGPVTPEPHISWTTIADENGNFTASWYVNDCELGADLLLGALGQTSGFTYEVFFTDAISLTPFTIGSQTGVLTSGTAGTVTYNSSMKISGAGSPVTINLGITGLPTGVSFSPASVASSNANPYNFTLTLTTTALTPSGTFPFVVTASGTDVNTATQTGTLVVNASCIPPAAPSVNTPLTYCQGSSADVLSATGANLLWYTTATGGTGSATAPTPSTALQGTVSYYVSQTIDCESPRAKIDVVVNGINPGTIGKGAVQPGPGCGTLDPGITSISTAASGSGALSYIWQQSTNGGTDWSTISSETSSQYNPPSLTTTTYYKRIVTSLLNGVSCSAESNVLIYEVNPLPIVASILPGGTTNVCVGGTLQLTNATSGGVWSSANTGIATVDTNGLVTGITFGDVSISYTITDVNTGCSKSANKTVHVLALPYAPIAIDYSGIYDGVSHSGSATINSGETIDWYTTATGQTATVAPVGTNVGTYSAYAEARNITTGCKSTTRTLVTVTISKANPTVVVTPYNVTYDRHVHTATYTISGVNGEIGATVGTINVTGTTHTDAGTYTGDAWSFTGASNYNDANGTVDNAIGKANPTVVVTPYNVTYDGQAHTATYTISGVNGEIGATVGTIDVKATTHTNAGTYTGDAWSFTGASNYNNANGTVDNAIGKANPTVVVTPYNVTYDGVAYTATYTISGVNGESGVTVGTIDVTATTHTNAGTYTGDAWSFTGASNYNNTNGTVNDVIGKANPTVVVTPYNVTYDGQAHTATYTISGVNGESGVTVGTIDVTATTHTNAGTYTGDAWSFIGASNYNNTSGTVNDVIGKANPTVVVTPYNVTYDGQAHTATYTISGVNGEVDETVGTINVTGTTHTDAGTYTGDAWSFTGASNYNDANGTVDNAIGKANPTVVVTPYNITYDGHAHTATYTISGVNGEIGATVGTINVTGTTHTNAGTYTGDAWSFTGASNYNDANGTVDNAIGKANPTVVVTPYNVTYDGHAHTATYTISGVNGEIGATVGTINVTGTTHTNAGTYTGDAWSFTGASNYNDANGTVDNAIGKANPTVVVTPYNVTYDGHAHTATYTISGVNGEIGATVGTINVTGTTHTNAGTYTGDAWSFTGASNYNDANGTVDNAIGKANPTVVVTPYNITYDGHAHTATYTISGVNGEIGATVGTINVTGTTHTNAGTYTGDAWSFTGASNYNDANGTVDNAIGKANPTVVVTPYNITYDGHAHTATYTISGVNGEIGATVGTINVTGTTHTNAGTYTGDAWSFTGASNYNDANGTVDNAIGKANPTVVVTPYNVTYDGHAHTATYTISGVNGEIGATVGTIDVTATTHTNAGTYAGDAWSFTGASNYNDANGTVDNAIGKANPTVVVTPYNVTYDGAAHTATYTISGVNGENGVTVGTIDVTATTHTNAGTYAGDAWSFTGASNYNDANGTVDNAIGKANPTVVVTPYNVTYDGAAHTATYTISGVNGEIGATVGTIDVTGTTHTNAGTYTGDAWSFTGVSNYNNTNGTVNDVIGKANPTIVVTPYNVTYDGQAHTATYTISGVNGESGVTVGTIDVTATTHTNAGTYTGDAWSFIGASNYNNTSGTVNDVISKAPTTVAFTFGNLIYDGNPKVAIATATGAGGLNQDLTVTYVGTGATVYGPSTEAPSLAGTYSASANFVETANYLASNKVQGFTILAASTTTTLTLSAPSVRYMDNITLTAKITPVNAASALTGKVYFKINGHNYGSADVVPIQGSGDGSVQAQLIVQVSEMPNVPSTATYSVVAEFVSTNDNYSGSSKTEQLNVRPRNADPFNATGMYTGDIFAWTTSTSTSTATITLAAVLKDNNIPKGDLRGAKVTFYLVNGSSLTPISSAQNIAVGLIDATDGSVGAASAIVQLNIGSQNAQSFHVAVGVSGAYTNNPFDAKSQCIVTVSKPVTGGYIVGGGKILNNNSAGLIKGHAGLCTDYEFDIQYTKSGTNPKGKVKIFVRSYYDKNGLLDSNIHKYIITSTAISLLNVGAPNATGTFSSKANLDEQLEDGSIVAIEGGATLQLLAYQNNCTQQLAITFYRKAGGIWFSSNWNATSTKTVLQDVTSNPKSCVSVAGGGSCSTSTLTARVDSMNLKQDIEVQEETTVEPTVFNVIAYPNPTVSVFTIEVAGNSTENIQVLVYDSAGRLLKVIDKKAGESISFGEDLPRGTYIAKITQGTESKTVNLIKK